MALGLLGTVASGALEGLGRSAAPLAEYTARSALAEEAAKVQAQRDAVLNEYQSQRDTRQHAWNVSMEKDVRQPFQTGERVAGQEFTKSIEKDIRQPFQREQQERGFTHTESMREAQQAFQAEQNEAQRNLTREQIASQQKIAAGNNAVALQVAKTGGTVQQDKEGKFFFMGKDGSTKPVMDPNDPSKQLSGFKDLTPAAKAYADVIKADLVKLTEQEVMGGSTPDITSRRAELTRSLLNVLIGGISEAGKPPLSTKTGWDSATGDVLVAGKKVGTAKTEKEARDIVARMRATSGGIIGNR